MSGGDVLYLAMWGSLKGSQDRTFSSPSNSLHHPPHSTLLIFTGTKSPFFSNGHPSSLCVIAFFHPSSLYLHLPKGRQHQTSRCNKRNPSAYVSLMSIHLKQTAPDVVSANLYVFICTPNRRRGKRPTDVINIASNI